MNCSRGTLFLLLAGTAILGFASCDLMLVTSVESRALDASVSHAAGVPGVRVTLAGNGGVFHTTTDHAGYWYLDRVPSGTYTVTASRTGWFFPPFDITVAGWGSQARALYGVPLNPADALGISFLLTWDESVRDLDLHLTAPVIDLSHDGDGFPVPTTTAAYNWHNGFGPATTANRTEVYHARRAYPSTANPSILLLRDSTGYGGAELITMRRFPFPASAWSGSRPIAPTHANGLMHLFPGSHLLYYRWMGVAEVYASRLPRNPDRADVTVHVFQTGASATSAHYLGAFRPPTTVTSGTASVIRVNLFLDSDGYEVFQLVADGATIFPGTPGILSGADGASIGVRGTRPDNQE
ncbi:MAG: carboxypeptidase regulatory-like domain-containing protein [Spirochaetaceae bacterium]|nr:MAG: carboxypeptidase regulatory-like domain-containing protein [Spirochaetaceae bacterium]